MGDTPLGRLGCFIGGRGLQGVGARLLGGPKGVPGCAPQKNIVLHLTPGGEVGFVPCHCLTE